MGRIGPPGRRRKPSSTGSKPPPSRMQSGAVGTQTGTKIFALTAGFSPLTDSILSCNMFAFRNFFTERRTMKVKFVDSALRSLKAHRVKYDVHDPEGAPLVLRVSSDGRKTWMACYSSPTGVMQFRAIGKYPMMSIAEAREKARSAVRGAQNSEPDG